jgi:hypothetical protein
MLECPWQQLSRQIDRQEPGVGIDVFVAGHGMYWSVRIGHNFDSALRFSFLCGSMCGWFFYSLVIWPYSERLLMADLRLGRSCVIIESM